MSLNTIIAIMVFLTMHEGIIVGGQGVNLRCLCIDKESKPIFRHIAVLEVHCPSSHCREVQIIAILKKSKLKVCLDPDAAWVKRKLKIRCPRQKAKERTLKAKI